MKTYVAPNLSLPLRGEARKDLLVHVHNLVMHQSGRDPKGVALRECADHFASEWADFFLKAIHEIDEELEAEFTGGDWPTDSETYRSRWISETVSRVFNHTPGCPPHYAVEAVFDYEVSGPGIKKRSPWEDAEAFASYMARRLVLAPVHERTDAQKLAHFGLVTADFQGIDLPGYVPPKTHTLQLPTRPEEPISSPVPPTPSQSDAFTKLFVLGILP